MPERAWGWSDVPDLTGRTAIVTGANSGVGLETAVGLAAHGARVVMACRDEVRAKAAAFHIRSVVDAPALEILTLDLASLESVRRAAQEYSGGHDRLDVLVNNAAIMGPPRLSSTDGYELQYATNHLGHYALTGLLLPSMLHTPGARVVTVTSPMHRMGRFNGTDPAHPERYRRWTAYGTSKLANLLFTNELERRLEQARADAPRGGGTPRLDAHQPPGQWAPDRSPRVRAADRPHGQSLVGSLGHERRPADPAGGHGHRCPGRRVLRAGRAAPARRAGDPGGLEPGVAPAGPGGPAVGGLRASDRCPLRPGRGSPGPAPLA